MATNRTFVQTVQGAITGQSDDARYGPEAVWNVTCKAPKVANLRNGYEAIKCNDGTWELSDGITKKTVTKASGDAYPGFLFCDNLVCASSDLRGADRTAGGTLSCQLGSASQPVDTDCYMSCPVGKELLPNASFHCMYVTPEQKAAYNATFFVDPGRKAPHCPANVSSPSCPADATATWALKQWPSEDLHFGRGKCMTISCEPPRSHGASLIGVPVMVQGKTVSAGNASVTTSNLECTGMQYGSTCKPICNRGYFQPKTGDGSGTLLCKERKDRKSVV